VSIDDFEGSLTALRSFAKEMGVGIEEVDSDFFGDFASAGFNTGDSIIRYCEDLHSDPEKLIYVVSHELGHAIDFDSMNEEERREFRDSTRFFNECVALESEFPDCVRNFVINSEKIACDYGDLLVRSLGITFGAGKRKSFRSKMLLGYRLLFQ
jgi:hypothetical protein